jgi:hypothetical protein
VSRLEQALNKPIVVLVVGVVAVALNVLLYFGYFLPRMAPLIAHISPIGISVPEAISKLGTEAGSKADPEAGSNSGAKASGESVSEGPVASQTDHSSADSPPNSPSLSPPPEASAPPPEAFEGLMSLAASALLLTLIHRSAWKGNSAKLNFRFTEFYEVRIYLILGSPAGYGRMLRDGS